jgi:hypothetical protein
VYLNLQVQLCREEILIDARIIHETRTGTATYGGGSYENGGDNGIIDSQEDVGGWPELLSASAPVDSDGDGIPDSWENENGLDPDDADDGKSIAGNGYTHLENYVHSIQTQGEFTPAPGTLALVSPVGQSSVSVQPEFTWESAVLAESYELEVRNGTSSSSDIIYAATVPDTMYAFPADSQLTGNETYFWRVRGKNGSGTGLWTDYEFFVTEMVTSTEEGINGPNDFTLSQNYPNPFNPTTNISYGLPQTAHVEIKVYDMAGREVAEVVNRNQSAGFHTVQFDASSLASGVYVYRLTAASGEVAGNTMYTLTRKMTLIK